MLPKRDTSTIGTIIGLIVFVIAIGGSVLFGWEWGAPNQPVATAVGGIAVIIAFILTIRQNMQ